MSTDQTMESTGNRDAIRWTARTGVCKEQFFLTESLYVDSVHASAELPPARGDWQAFAFLADLEIASGDVRTFGDIETMIADLEDSDE
ncbi:MAG: hypothetical protein ACF8NJ_07275 [Phycisphaerales bacterium JB038]